MYGAQTDLGGYYRGDLTLRQVYVRLWAILAGEPDSPIARLIVRMRDEAVAADDQRKTDEALAPFTRGGEA